MLTMSMIRAANKAAGHFWFEPDTMRFFRSRVGGDVFEAADGRGYFVSSERGPLNVRRYTVRVFDPATGDVDAVGEFQAYATRAAALRAAKAAAKVAKCSECGKCLPLAGGGDGPNVCGHSDMGVMCPGSYKRPKA